MKEEWYFTDPGLVPFVVSPILGTLRCCVPVVPGGDGSETIRLEARTERCVHRTSVLVGRAPTCAHHLRIAARIAGVKLRSWPDEECPA